MMFKEVCVAGLKKECSCVGSPSSSNEVVTKENKTEDRSSTVVDIADDDNDRGSNLDTSSVKCEKEADPCDFCSQVVSLPESEHISPKCPYKKYFGI